VNRRRLISALLAAGLPLIVYALSASPNPGFWDMGEMATVSYIFGIAHPTGFPLFVILGWFFTHLIPFGTVAWRATLVASAGCAAAAFAVWLALDALEIAPEFALGAAWWFAFGDVVWQRANRTDVHGLEVGFEALALAFAIRFNRAGGSAWAVAAAFATGCALATHPNALWLLPGIAILLLSRRGVPYLRVLIAGVLPLLAYLYIPLRSMYLDAHRIDPTLAIGVPPGQPFWNYGDPHTLGGFWWLISGAQWHTHGVFLAMLDPRQYVRGIGFIIGYAQSDHAAFALVLALIGFVALLVRALPVGLALAVSFLVWGAFVAGYQTMENDPARYLLAVYWMLTVFAACIWFIFARLRVLRWALTAASLFLGASLLWFDQPRFLEAYDPLAAPYIARVIGETGPHDVIVAQWTYVTPLAYAKYVTHTLGDRIVVNGGPPEGDALIAQLAQAYPTDIILEHPVAIPGVRLSPLDHAFPTVYRVMLAH
jgi:hypothetical protein